MTARPDSFMPIYWGDYARDTAHLNNAEHGAYLMLIKHYWCSGEPLPDNDQTLARVACCDSIKAWKQVRGTVARFFQVENGEWRHKRIDIELKEAAARYARRSRAGQKGNAARWGGDGPDDGGGIAKPSHSESQCDTPRENKAITKRSQPQPQKSSRTSSEAKASGGKPPDPIKTLFDFGIGVLTAAKVPERQARSLIGGWRKELDDDAKLMNLLLAAHNVSAVEPVAYVTAAVAAEIERRRIGPGTLPLGVGG